MNKFKIISFLILTSFSSFSFAGAAEDRTQSIIDQALSTKSYSSATGHNYTVGGVKADNGKLVATVAQRVVVDGSAATVTQKVTIPANDAFYNKTAGFAKGLLRGGAVGVAASLAMQKLLDGVGYVMGEGGQITKKPSQDDLDSYNNTHSKFTSPVIYYVGSLSAYSSSSACNAWAKDSSRNGQTFSITSVDHQYCYYNAKDDSGNVWNNQRQGHGSSTNPDYNPSYTPDPLPVQTPSDPQIEDAFSNWLKSNPSSVTDPVTTYIYSPKTPTGAAATTPQNNPSFGQQEITDEMMNNYLANRNAELYANDVAANQAAIRDSAQTETEAKPDGTKTETKPNPDGSKTETKTETKTNPDTGEVETTVTETVINPDGSRGESKQTETKTETKPNPETTTLKPACEYLAFLCDFVEWYKKPAELGEDPKLPIKEIDQKNINPNLVNINSNSCPAPYPVSIDLPVLKTTYTDSIDISPYCSEIEKLAPVLQLLAFVLAVFIIKDI